MGNDIVLSKKYGVNPSVTQCFYCGEDCGIALFGSGFRENGVEAEAPRNIGVLDMTPCSKCEDYMKQGIIVISMRDGEAARIEEQRLDWKARFDALSKYDRKHDARPFIPEVYRTGLWTVIKADSRVFTDMNSAELRGSILRQRWTFMENGVVDKLGLGAAAGMALDAEGHWNAITKEKQNAKKARNKKG